MPIGDITKLIPNADDIRESLVILRKIYSALKPFEVLNREMEIKVPEQTGHYSCAVAFPRKELTQIFPLKFPATGISSIVVHSMDLFLPIEGFFTRVDDTWVSDISRLPEGIDKLLFEFEIVMPNPNFLENLVRRDKAREVIGEERHEYWLHAQIRHPEQMKQFYGRLELSDVPLMVNVGVHQDIRNLIPRPFIESLKTQQDLLRETDRNKRLRLALELTRGPFRFTGQEHTYFSDLQDLFLPDTFRRFLEVTSPFEYQTCIRGQDFYELTFPTFPKSMEVVSRTNLSLDKLAAEGKLIYAKSDLLKDVKKIFHVK